MLIAVMNYLRSPGKPVAWCMVAAMLLITSGYVRAQTSVAEQQLNAVMAEYWDYFLRENPLAATHAGISEFNDRMPKVTLEDQARRLEAERRFLRRARDVDGEALGLKGQVNAELFMWVLEDSIAAYELNLSRIPFNTFSGFFMNALTASNGVLMGSVSDYEDYIARLRDIPRYFDENLDNMRVGMRSGFVLPQIVIDGILPTIKAQIKDDPEDSPFFEPLQDLAGAIPDAAKKRFREDARDAIASAVMPAFARLAVFLEREYQASKSLGAEDMVGGREYYAFQIRRYTTLVNVTSDQIHDIGVAEVARIRGDMNAIIEELAFDGDFSAFAQFLRTDPQFYATTAEELLKDVAYTAKRIDHRMPAFFKTLPRQSYGVLPVPDEIAPNYVTGSYNPAPLGGSHGGEFWVNTYALDQRPLFEIPALTLHEAVPGHHHQGALAREMPDVPEFRRDLYFSAFGEGWALYAEKLGVEMGIYRTPYEHFGRLSYEMWRACRLVIDTGIHARGWSRQRAIDFMSDNTSLSAGNIRAEIDRYISWPGQALAYKLGELKIWEMRRKAQSELGDDFDLREFHDVLLGNGALPMAMLEAVVDRFIADKLSQQ